MDGERGTKGEWEGWAIVMRTPSLQESNRKTTAAVAVAFTQGYSSRSFN